MVTNDEHRPVRRGLARTTGSDPAGEPSSAGEPPSAPEPALGSPVASGARRTGLATPAAAARQSAAPVLTAQSTTLLGRLPAKGWTLVGVTVLIGFAGLIVAAAAVLGVRGLLTVEDVQDFLLAYPGEYPLPADAEVGFPAWAQWQHYFNAFFMVLIVRTGLQVRYQARPAVFWTPRWAKNGRGKISLSLWFHQSLDVLWLVNGVTFVVLLFSTNHWMRIVPSSWEVFPNAVSAAIQYASLDWPTENGWVNYNSLQQLLYFVTVFVAAPLAAATGLRMSDAWPKKAALLNRLYPVEWARAVHFPVMLYFVGFTIVHIALVFATGALRNLNHIYAGTDELNWTGFLIFAGSSSLIIAVWVAARPLVLATIARATGKLSNR